jgi:signal transduction histidine kinase
VEHFHFSAQVAATGLYLMMARQHHEQMAENLVGVLSETGGAEPEADTGDLTEALAEVAAGFAHELNNPLAVISGRAQLLAETLTDESARRSLSQIQDQARQVSALLEGLMGYAEPSSAHRALTPVGQILEEALGLAQQRLPGVELDLHVETAAEVGTVFVDSAQMATALSNVLVNAFESYADGRGRVEVHIEREAAAGTVTIRVRDHGCGMDAETVRKATLPFFSAKPAGRKRGLGLAFADRLIRLNEGALRIDSKPGVGTTVTLDLPLQA